MKIQENLVNQAAEFMQRYITNILELEEPRIQVIPGHLIGHELGFEVLLAGHKIPLDYILIDRSNFERGLSVSSYWQVCEELKSKMSSVKETYRRYLRLDRISNYKRKQLRYFRKRYGPNIDFEHLANLKRI